MLAHPDHVQGEDQSTARIVRACRGQVLLKSGAEGFVMAAAPGLGLGIAIKMADGAARGKFGVLARLLGRLGVLPEAEAAALVASVEPPTLDSNGQEVGRTEIVFGQDAPRRRRAGLERLLAED
jgi:L-asparaginase II